MLERAVWWVIIFLSVDYISVGGSNGIGVASILNYENFELIFMFTNSTGRVIAVETAHMPSGGSLVKTLFFDVTIPCKLSYEYISVGYQFKAREAL